MSDSLSAAVACQAAFHVSQPVCQPHGHLAADDRISGFWSDPRKSLVPNPDNIPKGTYEEVGISMAAAGTSVCILVAHLAFLVLAINRNWCRDLILMYMYQCVYVCRKWLSRMPSTGESAHSW